MNIKLRETLGKWNWFQPYSIGVGVGLSGFAVYFAVYFAFNDTYFSPPTTLATFPVKLILGFVFALPAAVLLYPVLLLLLLVPFLVIRRTVFRLDFESSMVSVVSGTALALLPILMMSILTRSAISLDWHFLAALMAGGLGGLAFHFFSQSGVDQ